MQHVGTRGRGVQLPNKKNIFCKSDASRDLKLVGKLWQRVIILSLPDFCIHLTISQQ